jgi:DNA-binding IclR family transcriptional regulator
MAQLRDALGRDSAIALARCYQDRVVFVHFDRARDIPTAPVRGEQISLFSPAAVARAILFALPDRVLRTLYQRHAADIAAQGLGDDARTFRANVKALRERGWVTADSAIVRGRVVVAAPVVCDGTVRGSMGVSLPAPLPDREIERIGAIVVQRASLVAAQLREDEPDVPRLLSRRPSTPAQVGSTLQ